MVGLKNKLWVIYRQFNLFAESFYLVVWEDEESVSIIIDITGGASSSTGKKFVNLLVKLWYLQS